MRTLLCLLPGSLSRCRERHSRVRPEAQLGRHSGALISIDPCLAGRAHVKVAALPVRQKMFTVARGGSPDLKVVQTSHGVPKIDCDWKTVWGTRKCPCKCGSYWDLARLLKPPNSPQALHSQGIFGSSGSSRDRLRLSDGGGGSIERWAGQRFNARGGCIQPDKLLLELLHSDLRRRVLSPLG